MNLYMCFDWPGKFRCFLHHNGSMYGVFPVDCQVAGEVLCFARWLRKIRQEIWRQQRDTKSVCVSKLIMEVVLDLNICILLLIP